MARQRTVGLGQLSRGLGEPQVELDRFLPVRVGQNMIRPAALYPIIRDTRTLPVTSLIFTSDE